MIEPTDDYELPAVDSPRRVVSVSLGSSKRDKLYTATIQGQEFSIERLGTDGDLSAFKKKFEDLDGKVDALGVGGAVIYLTVGDRKYTFRQIKNLISGVKKTPVVCGSGLKNTLERETINILTEVLDWSKERVLVVSAVDRYGMAQAIADRCPNVVYGDVMFSLGVPIPIRSYKTIKLIANVTLPIITKLPFKWFYPTGKQQEERTPKCKKWFDWATVICGDWHYIRRYAPDQMRDKTILTNTIRKADLEWLKTTGAKQVITTTPAMGGETYGTNVMEGVVIALKGKRPEEMSDQDYRCALKELGWTPSVLKLQE